MLKRLGRTLWVVSLFTLAGLPSPTAAQRTYPTPKVYNPNVYSRTRQVMTDRAIMRAALEKRRQSSSSNGAPGARPSTFPSSKPTPPAGSVTFRPVADQIAPRNMALALGDTPEEQKRLEAMFSEALEHYRGRLKQAGLPTNDVARAAAYLVTAGYYAANDGVPLDDAQLDGLRKHLREFFSTDETFQRMSDRERQELFEDYGITATWIDAGFNIVKQAGDHEGLRQWRQMGRQNFVAVLGAPPESVVITPRGVEYK
ncbi:MAG: hypothetical protein JOZ02_18875 [Acidobacteria bacterium]|nr:hypothetical protein [Acidobacteriota bacterium]